MVPELVEEEVDEVAGIGVATMRSKTTKTDAGDEPDVVGRRATGRSGKSQADVAGDDDKKRADANREKRIARIKDRERKSLGIAKKKEIIELNHQGLRQNYKCIFFSL